MKLEAASRPPLARVVLTLAALAAFAIPAGSAWAKKDGVSGYSGRFGATCSSCHAVGAAPVVAPTPTVTITGPTSVAAGTTNTYTITIAGGIPVTGTGGINVAASGGTLIASSARDTQLLNGEIAHKDILAVGPKTMDASGRAFWEFQWQAPATNGSYTLFGAGLNGNGDLGFYGDTVGTATLAITVAGGAAQAPIASTGGPYTAATGTPVQFNGSGSYDGDGTVNSYSWDFGDGGTATGPTPTHTYAAAGLYTVTLTVTDNSGMTGTASTTVNVGTGAPPPPLYDGAALYASNCQGCHSPLASSAKLGRSGLAIQNAITNNVGGMGSATLRALNADQINAIATALGGTPNATGGGGAPAPQPPVANAGGPYTGTVGTPVQFNGSGSFDPDGTVNSYSWNFGDGTTGTGATPTHAYSAAGVYTVTLTVTDNAAQTGSIQTTASIGTTTPPPPPPPDGAALYGQYCAGCHQPLASTTKPNRTAQQITTAIQGNVGGMGSLSGLSSAQIDAIAAALVTTAPPPPPVTDGATLYGQYCAGCHNPLASTTKPNRTAQQITTAIQNNVGGMGGLSTLTSTQISAIAAALVTTAPPPPPPPPTTDGLALYGQYCAGCHGTAPGTKAGRSGAQIQSAIQNVGAMQNLSTLTVDQINAIAIAIGGQGNAGTGGGTVSPGQALYDANCAGCHGAGGSGGPDGSVVGASASKISEAISNESQMRFLSTLSSTQIQQIATYLSGKEQGKALYDANCAGCHGAGGSGGPDGSVVGASASKISEAISNESQMRFLSTLSSTQIQQIATYLSGKEQGKALYDANCAGCHGAGGSGGPDGSVVGASASKISEAISNESQMRFLSTLTSAQRQQIAAYLSDPGCCTGGGTTPPPPPPPTTTDGATLYGQYCQSCHGALATSTKRGRTATQITTAIQNNTGGMGTTALRALTSTQISAIATALANTGGGGTTPPPTGTDGLSLYGQYCAGCHGTAPGAKAGRSGAQIKSAIQVNAGGMGSLSMLTDAQINAIASAIGGTPNAGTGGGTVPRGQALYDANCAGCHGAGGSGGKDGSVKGASASKISEAISKESAMRFLSTLSSADIAEIASYLSGSTATSPTSGQGLYNSYCAGCHGAGGRGGPDGDVRGSSSDEIKSAIRGERDMRYLSGVLTDSQIKSIASYLKSLQSD